MADGYIPNPTAINNDTPVPGVALSDYRSNIDEILTSPDPEKNKLFENSDDIIELRLKYISETDNLINYVPESTGYFGLRTSLLYQRI